MGSRTVYGRGPVCTATALASFLLLSAVQVAAQSVTITIPTGTTIPMVDGTAQVTLTIAGTSTVPDPGITAFDLTLNYNANVTATGAVLPAAGDAANCDPPTFFEVMPGSFNISLTCATNQLKDPGPGAIDLVVITFEGNSTGMTPISLGDCEIDEFAVTCNSVAGDITVLGPTSTSTPTASVTPTSTITATASQTATQTSTFTIAPSATSTPTVPTPTTTPTASVTPTATNTPPSTATSTATLTLSATPSSTSTPTRTATATATNTPIPTPRITSGNTEGSTRVTGAGAGNVPQGDLRIFGVGPNGNPDGCAGDDEPLGTGGTDPTGGFNDGADGIGLNRELVAGERILPCDFANGLVGPPVVVTGGPPAPIPTMTEVGAAALASLLGLALLWRLAIVRRRIGE